MNIRGMKEIIHLQTSPKRLKAITTFLLSNTKNFKSLLKNFWTTSFHDSSMAVPKLMTEFEIIEIEKLSVNLLVI
jgi:hypothetical protein